jgi:hypothetical protein
MLKGTPPFIGSLEDIREAHLQTAPPPLPEAGGRLQAFIQQMLRKVPPSRPTLDRCVSVFNQAQHDEALAKVHPGLAEAASAVAAERAAAEARQLEEQTRDREWAALAQEGSRELDGVVDRLFSVITDFSDEARREGRLLQFGQGELAINVSRVVNRNHEGGPNVGSATNWTVAAWSDLWIKSPRYLWSATLVYSAVPDDPSFRWREIGFWSWGTGNRSEPFAVEPTSRDFEFAVSTSVSHSVNIAYGPFAIDAEDEASFQKRCIALLTKAATDQLERPGAMPVPGAYWN